jgi:hypothetical protein
MTVSEGVSALITTPTRSRPSSDAKDGDAYPPIELLQPPTRRRRSLSREVTLS